MSSLSTEGDQRVEDLVALLNEYKYYIEFDLIYCSKNDFLYRQSGQLKLASTIMEEFLPMLTDPSIIPSLKNVPFYSGPQTAFASVSFAASLASSSGDVGLLIRTKDQDFTVGRPVYLKASFDEGFPASETTTERVFLAFVAAECKTNLDKTMMQEAAATAHDLRIAIPGSHYFLLCEWLDMTPISTAGTDIDEVIIFRHKRVQSAIRKDFSTYAGRMAAKDAYGERLRTYPIRKDMVLRLVDHMRRIFEVLNEPESRILERGYF